MVSQWNDKGSSGINLAQATGASKPTYVSAVQNGKNIIRFGGSQVLAASASAILNAATAWSFFFLDKPSSILGGVYAYRLQFSGSTDVIGYIQVSTGQTIAGGRTSGTQGTLIDTTPRSTSVFQVQAVTTTFGAAISMYLNNTQTATNATFLTSGSISNGGSNLFVGSGTNPPAGGFPYSGDVAEIIVYNTALSTQNRNLVYNYLKAKWGL